MKTSWRLKLLNLPLAGGIALLSAQLSANASSNLTTTTLLSAANPVGFGESVMLVAKVTPVKPNTAIPTGTITFVDGTVAVSTVPLDKFGDATFTTRNLAMGSHFLTASYDGDGHSQSSQSSTLNQLISKPQTTVKLTSSSNPVPLGEGFSITATVIPVVMSSVAPTGSVIFKEGNTTLGIISLSSGEASFSRKMPLGSHSITAAYYGDSNFDPGTSGSLMQVVTKDPTTVALSSSLNPSTAGQAISFDATVTGGSSVDSPTGTVQFQVDGANFGSAVELIDGTAEGPPMATMPQGTHVIAATYSGDGIFESSTGSGSQTVNPGSASCTVSNNGPLCTGATLQLSGTTSDTNAGVFYSWSGPNGFTSSQQNPTIANVTSANAGTYVLMSGTSQSTNCIVQTVVTIAEPLNVAIAGDNTVCPNSTSTFTGPPSMDSYAWSVQGGAEIVGSTNDQKVSVTAASGCNTNFLLDLTATLGTCSKTISKTVAVAHTTAPVITAFPPDATYPCADFVTPADDSLVKATDGCGAGVTISHNADVIASNGCPNRFTVTRVYTATDACGLSSSRTQTITINDSTGPSFAGVPADVTVNIGAVPPAKTLVAVDDCEGNPVVVFKETSAPGASAGSSVLTRTWTATDACGNSTVAVQKVTVLASGAQASR